MTKSVTLAGGRSSRAIHTALALTALSAFALSLGMTRADARSCAFDCYLKHKNHG